MSDLHAVSSDLVAFWRSEALFSAVNGGLFESLPVRAEGLPVGKARLLSALASMGYVELTNGEWTATSKGQILTAGHPSSLRPAALYWNGLGRQPWGELDKAAFDPSWTPHDPFETAARVPQGTLELQAGLDPYARHDYSALPAAVPAFARHTRLIDAGGGAGSLSVSLLRAYPSLQAVVLDRPEVAAIGHVPTDVAGRLSFAGGDFFGPWAAQADAIILARVLHDWDDGQALKILTHAAEALLPGGRLYIAEMVLAGDRPHSTGLLNLHLFVTSGGTERSRLSYESLLSRAGLCVQEVVPLPGSFVSVLVCAKV